MEKYLADLIPRIKKFSQKLDNIALLADQHWVIFNGADSSKVIYIFRSNKQLLVSTDGVVSKGSWEYLGNNSLLIEKPDGSFLLKHGFFDETVLVLEVENTGTYYAMVNEEKSKQVFKSIEQVAEFLTNKYMYSEDTASLPSDSNRSDILQIRNQDTDKGIILIHRKTSALYAVGDEVFLGGKHAPDGKYRTGLFVSLTVKNGFIIKI
ncbi:MAG: hypothetical protein IPJ06_14965 [Saprospiraceae bacterium]|nr:hypothetical protein [Saprospiraceae bacterium]